MRFIVPSMLPLLSSSRERFFLRTISVLSYDHTHRTHSGVVSCALWVATGGMGFLLQGNRVTVMEKKRTDSGPLIQSTRKHSSYTQRRFAQRARD